MKRAITGIVAASLTLGTMAPAAFAATASAPSYFGSQIHVGTYNANVQALKVQDAGNTTALFPFYYIQQGLKAAGYTVTWDGVAKRLDITTPNGVNFDQTNLNPGVGAVGIYINGILVQRAPFEVAKDMGGNKQATSFMAAYYLDQALARVGITNTYDGTGAGWTLTPPAPTAGPAASVKLFAASSSMSADGAATDTVTVKVYDANGVLATNFNGTVNVSDSAAQIEQPAGPDANTLTNVTIKNGVGTFTIDAQGVSGIGADQNLTAYGLTPATGSTTTTNVSYGSVAVSQVAPVATKLAVAVTSGSAKSISANTSSPTSVTVSIEDTDGNTWAGQAGQYVNLTISGPGTFDGGVTSETVWVNGSQSFNINSQAGVPGNIVVTAAASGLTGGSLTVPTYINTDAHSLSVQSSNGTDSLGNGYTLYTVQLLDTNGHPITNQSGSLSVTDNHTAQGGSVVYGQVSSAGVFSSSAVPVNYTNGVLTFAVETASVGTSPLTLTIKDATNNLSTNASYSFTAGAPSKVVVSPSSSVTGYNLQAGQTATITAQLEDTNSNPVALAGKNVTFSFVSDTASATFPNGLGNGGTYTATTDANGKASVTVTVPSGASAAQAFQVGAVFGTNSAVNSATYTVAGAVGTATQVKIANTPSTAIVANGTVAGVTATPENAVGTPVGTDTLQISTSNASVLPVPTPDTAGGSVQTLLQGVTTIPTLTAQMAGTATITVTDISNPAKPSATFTVSVIPGQATAVPAVEFNGKAVSGSNPLSVTANTPVALTVVNVDAGGNPVPVSGSSAQAVELFDTNGGGYRLTPSGADVNTVSIPVGQTSVTVYYVNPSTPASPITSGLTAAYQAASAANSTVTSTATATAGDNNVTVKVTPKDQNGNALGSGQTVTVSDGGAYQAATWNAANSDYEYTFSEHTAGSKTFSAKVGTTTVTATASSTINAAAVSQYVFSPTSLSATSVVVTAEDQYNNAVKNAVIYLAFTSTAATTPATASVGATPLTGTAASFTADANGQVTVSYTAGTGAAGNTDTLTATNAASSATVTGTATHAY